MNESRTTERFYESRPGVRRKKGKPRRESQNDVMKAVKYRGKDWNEMTKFSQDRKRWRQFWMKEDVRRATQLSFLTYP